MHPLSYNAAAWHAVNQNQPWWNTRQRGREICALCMSATLLQSITCSILDQRSLLRFSGDGFEASGKGGCWRSQEPEGKLGSSQAAGEDHQVEGQVNGRQQGFWPSGKNLSSVTVRLGFDGWPRWPSWHWWPEQRVGARLDPSKLALSRPGEATISPWWPLSPFTPSIYSLGRKNLYVLLPLKHLAEIDRWKPQDICSSEFVRM